MSGGEEQNIDWQGLLNWSTKYHDGTAPSDVQPMSEEDREWLQQAMKQYTYDDTDKLKEICEQMNKEVESNFDQTKGSKSGDELYNMLDDLQNLIELHERNSLNLAITGGLKSLMSYIFSHPDSEARVIACQIYSQVVSNNPQLQDIAGKLESLQIVGQIMKEEKFQNKEAALGALSSLIRSSNFKGKREFLNNFHGFQFIYELLSLPNGTVRLQKKLVFLLNDLIQTQDKVFPDETKYISNYLVSRPEYIQLLVDLLVKAGLDLNNGQYWDLRENILRILSQVLNDDLFANFKQILILHKLKLAQELQKCDQDQQDLYLKEISLIDKCENFKKEQSEENQEEAKINSNQEVKMLKM